MSYNFEILAIFQKRIYYLQSFKHRKIGFDFESEKKRELSLITTIYRQLAKNHIIAILHER